MAPRPPERRRRALRPAASTERSAELAADEGASGSGSTVDEDFIVELNRYIGIFLCMCVCVCRYENFRNGVNYGVIIINVITLLEIL